MAKVIKENMVIAKQDISKSSFVSGNWDVKVKCSDGSIINDARLSHVSWGSNRDDSCGLLVKRPIHADESIIVEIAWLIVETSLELESMLANTTFDQQIILRNPDGTYKKLKAIRVDWVTVIKNKIPFYLTKEF